MTIPEGFEAVPITQPHVEIALRHNKGGYPTFNILLLPHTVRDLEEPSAFANRTLESYRNVGLTKAKIEEFGWLNFGTHKACFARLSYQYNQDELQSIVAGLMLPQKELLATFVDKGPDLERNLPLMETIMNSLELLEAPANSAAEEMGYNEELRHAILLYIVLFLIIISAGGVYLLRKKHLNKSSGRFLR